MAERFLIVNGPRPTAAVQAVVATGTDIKTMLQVKMGASVNHRAKVIEWGVSFAAAADAAKIACELLSTKAVAATVTAHVAAGIINLDPKADVPTDEQPFDLGTAATGYTGSAEGTVTDTRPMDPQLVSPAGQYVKQYPLDREPEFDNSEFLRIRVHAPADVNCLAYVVIEI